MSQINQLSDAAKRKRIERDKKRMLGLVYVQVVAFKEDSYLIRRYAKKLLSNK